MIYDNTRGLAKAQAEYDRRMPPDDDEDYHAKELADIYANDADLCQIQEEIAEACAQATQDRQAEVEARMEHLRYSYWQERGRA